MDKNQQWNKIILSTLQTLKKKKNFSFYGKTVLRLHGGQLDLSDYKKSLRQAEVDFEGALPPL